MAKISKLSHKLQNPLNSPILRKILKYVLRKGPHIFGVVDSAQHEAGRQEMEGERIQ